MVKVFIVDRRENSQSHLEESRAERERERSRLNIARTRETGETSGDTEIARDREQSLATESRRAHSENSQVVRWTSSWGREAVDSEMCDRSLCY